MEFLILNGPQSILVGLTIIGILVVCGGFSYPEEQVPIKARAGQVLVSVLVLWMFVSAFIHLGRTG